MCTVSLGARRSIRSPVILALGVRGHKPLIRRIAIVPARKGTTCRLVGASRLWVEGKDGRGQSSIFNLEPLTSDYHE